MNSNESPPAQLMKFIVSRWISKPIYVAAELGIADLLAEGPKSIGELARESETHAPFLYRTLRALASVGIFSENEGRKFELTPMADYLKSGAMRSIAQVFNAEWSDKAWGCFLESVKTGETPFEIAYGMTVTDWLEKNPPAAKVFNEANAIKAAVSHRAIVDAYDFSGIRTLTDVGGGIGLLMVEILTANPSMEGVILEIPSVVIEAKKLIRARGFESRCQAMECDFFIHIPSGSDAYLLSNILHDWADDKCHRILTNCHKAMKADSKLLVMEMIVPPGNEPSVAKLLDLEMLVTTGGRERMEAEFKEIFELSGFKLARLITTGENVCIIEGIRED
ncbi:MAG: methyltransferase [Candidatus Zixiibacteriota bacterium]|nr:MAG: methyltransferase [candidate division Zixibacteria bacterium]